MTALPQPEWFRDKDQCSAETEADNFRNLSNRRKRAQRGGAAEAMPISRAQLLLQYLIALEHFAPESQ
jgi:hypothetical protein